LASLNQRIRADIERRILSGEWPPGHRIPFEHELMVTYGCARMTVNKVLSSLVAAGLIERRRRAGSFVRHPFEQTAVLEIPDLKLQVSARGQVYRYELLSRVSRRATPDDQRLLSLSPSAVVLTLDCRHWADDQPFALEQRRIVLDEIPTAATADFSLEPPGSWLLSHVAWHEAEHRITAQAAPDPIARLLAVPIGCACLVVDRRTWRAAQALTGVRMWYPGDQHALTARFTPLAQS
jgi:GntR family histidine utilization transcriptional repressor